jgi:phosphoserine phosphatase
MEYALVLVARPENTNAQALAAYASEMACIANEKLAPKMRWLGWHHYAALETLITPEDDSALEQVREHIDALAGEAGYDWALIPAQGRRKSLLICDMDSTIIEQECIDELADYVGKREQIAAITEEAMRGNLDFEAALRKRVAMLAGLEQGKLADCVKSRISLSPGARLLVRTMAANGAYCVLVSGGFTFFTSRVAAAAGFHADFGNRLVLEHGRLTGHVADPILGREAKLDTLLDIVRARKLSVEDALAIGDGANDLAMIGAAGLGLAYHAKPSVAAMAHARIEHTGLETALFFQGYAEPDFVSEDLAATIGHA